MRADALLVLLAGLAGLAVPAAAEKLSLPDIVKEAQSPKAFTPEPQKAKPSSLGMDGKLSMGMAIVPPRHADERALIVPPDPNDPIALELGTNQLRDREPRVPWWPRDLSLAFKAAADRIWDHVLPEL